ncbi:MAG: 2-hydroxyglutaryl-CoA dehydratase, partial [Anaerococcus hydrogenalis]|nr:2-hydroxyglutaryl-CoA dehydratase [Anaerococcus hydrogenalis]
IINDIVEEFDNVEILDIKKPKAGIVGEILVKYLKEANNHLQDTLEEEGAEVIVPDLMDFFMYCLKNTEIKKDLYGKSPWTAFFGKTAINTIEIYRKPIRKALKKSKRFSEPVYINDVVDFAKEVTSIGNQAGEGWLLAGEMVELIHQDAPNIVCIKIREIYPQANIVAIDYDPGASEVNQINRVKLMMSQARENLKENVHA